MSGDPQPMKQTMVAEWVSEAANWEHHISGLTFFLHCRRLGLVTDEQGVLIRGLWFNE